MLGRLFSLVLVICRDWRWELEGRTLLALALSCGGGGLGCHDCLWRVVMWFAPGELCEVVVGVGFCVVSEALDGDTQFKLTNDHN